MGARSKSMLARQPAANDLSLLAPAGLEALVGQRNQCLRGVVPVTALRPGDNQGASRERQRFIQGKARAAILRPDLAVGVEENATRLVRALGVGPMLGRRRRQVATVLTQVEARLPLHEILNVDQDEV